MWWFVGVVALFSVLLILSLCKMSGAESRKEEKAAVAEWKIID